MPSLQDHQSIRRSRLIARRREAAAVLSSTPYRIDSSIPGACTAAPSTSTRPHSYRQRQAKVNVISSITQRSPHESLRQSGPVTLSVTPVSAKTAPRKKSGGKTKKTKADSGNTTAMTTSFLQFCATCERQILVPDHSILYCSEHCRRLDGLSSVPTEPPTSLPLIGSTKSKAATKTREGLMLKPSSDLGIHQYGGRLPRPSFRTYESCSSRESNDYLHFDQGDAASSSDDEHEPATPPATSVAFSASRSPSVSSRESTCTMCQDAVCPSSPSFLSLSELYQQSHSPHQVYCSSHEALKSKYPFKPTLHPDSASKKTRSAGHQCRSAQQRLEPAKASRSSSSASLALSMYTVTAGPRRSIDSAANANVRPRSGTPPRALHATSASSASLQDLLDGNGRWSH